MVRAEQECEYGVEQPPLILKYKDYGAAASWDLVKDGFAGTSDELEDAVLAGLGAGEKPSFSDREEQSVRAGVRVTTHDLYQLSMLPYLQKLVQEVKQ